MPGIHRTPKNPNPSTPSHEQAGLTDGSVRVQAKPAHGKAECGGPLGDLGRFLVTETPPRRHGASKLDSGLMDVRQNNACIIQYVPRQRVSWKSARGVDNQTDFTPLHGIWVTDCLSWRAGRTRTEQARSKGPWRRRPAVSILPSGQPLRFRSAPRFRLGCSASFAEPHHLQPLAIPAVQRGASDSPKSFRRIPLPVFPRLLILPVLLAMAGCGSD